MRNLPPRLWNTGLVSSRASLTSWGEGVCLALVGYPSSDGVTIKMPYGVDVLHCPASHPIFSYWVGWITNWTSKILTKFDLDSLNASEEESKLVRAFAQINLSLLIAYFSSMLSEIGDIILGLSWVGLKSEK